MRVPIKMKRGLYQGDTLLFCLCVAPVSTAIRRKIVGFHPEYHANPLTHLMFVDDLKEYTNSAAELEHTVRVVSVGCGWMQMGLKKCIVAHMVGGRTAEGEGITLAGRGEIAGMGPQTHTNTWECPSDLGRTFHSTWNE